MTPQLPQAPHNLSPDELASNLAFVTHLSEQQMPKDPQGQQSQSQPGQSTDTSQSPETAPGDTQEAQETQSSETPQQESQENEQITTLTKDVAELKGNLEGMITSKFDALTKTIADALKQ